jgi:hypothetical protein
VAPGKASFFKCPGFTIVFQVGVIKFGSPGKLFFQIPGFRGRFMCSIGLCHCFPGGGSHTRLSGVCAAVFLFFSYVILEFRLPYVGGPSFCHLKPQKYGYGQ